MNFGGWSADGTCLVANAGMPTADVPGWAKVDDDHGCAMWQNTSTGLAPSQICNYPITIDGGLDAQTD